MSNYRCDIQAWKKTRADPEEMKIAELKKMRDRETFRPFAIHLTNGESMPVDHPELLSISPEVQNVFTLWVGREWNLIEVSEVSRISVLTKGKHQAKQAV